MENKIGINNEKILEIENKIVELKLKLLDKDFNFNKNKIDFEYLVELNKFLYGDIYNEKDLINSNIDKNRIMVISFTLDKVCKCFIDYKSNEDEIKSLLKRVMDLKPFTKGNQNTVMGLFYILSSLYLVNFNTEEKINTSNEKNNTLKDETNTLNEVINAQKNEINSLNKEKTITLRMYKK